MIFIIDDFAKAPKMQLRLDKKRDVNIISLIKVQESAFSLSKCDLLLLACKLDIKRFLLQYEKIEMQPYILALDFDLRRALVEAGIKKVLPIPLDTDIVNIESFLSSILSKKSEIILIGEKWQEDFASKLRDNGFAVNFVVGRQRNINKANIAFLQENLQSLQSATIVLLDIITSKEFFAFVDKKYLTSCIFACLSPEVAEVCLDNGFSQFVIADEFNVVGLSEEILYESL